MAERFSGKDGKIMVGSSNICGIRNWTFTKRSKNPRYQTSCTAGYEVSDEGGKTGSGSFQYVLDADDPLDNDITEGTAVTLLLYVDSTRFYTVPARIDSVGVTVDIDQQGEPVGGPVEFSTNGAWTEPTWA